MHLTQGQKIYYTLRFAAAMCFIGHGAFGIITKQIWCNYFAVFGIGQSMAYTLMPFVGVVDIALGLLLLVYPVRAAALWLVVWGLITASLRPVSGEPFAEFIERAGNYGAPFVLLLVQGGFKMPLKRWFTRMDDQVSLDEQTLKQVILYLRVFACLLLLGHGWLNIIQKQGLINQYHALGFNDPGRVALAVGVFELLAALSVLVRPFANILLVFIIWKAASELFYPKYEIFEWIERGGSYGVLLSLWFAIKYTSPGFNIYRFNKSNLKTN